MKVAASGQRFMNRCYWDDSREMMNDEKGQRPGPGAGDERRSLDGMYPALEAASKLLELLYLTPGPRPSAPFLYGT